MHQVQYLTEPTRHQNKENLYVEVRQREGRVLSDAAVQVLPFVAGSSPFVREWAWRRRSFSRFQAYLGAQSKPLSILDLGCGNGWMSNRLAEQLAWEVWAVDLNQVELEQGARLFGRHNLRFVYADILDGVLPAAHFDIIVLAASVQYFPDLPVLVAALRKCLATQGEIHILDSNFYLNEPERLVAKTRSEEYYKQAGVPGMASNYYHHLWPIAQSLGAVDLNDTLKIKLLQRIKWLGPFPWIRL